jgi:hypothetical protein
MTKCDCCKEQGQHVDRGRAVLQLWHCMRSSLDLVATSIAKMRELGIPITDDEARKIEGYARVGLGEKKD